MKGNFKVRCVSRGLNRFYTVGKTYEFQDGFMINDMGEKFPYHKGIDNFKEWQNFSASAWELVTDTKEITIRQKGHKVMAVMTEDGKYIKSAKAKYNPNDEKEGLPFDFEIGAKLAFDRLMGRVGQLNLKTTNPSFDWEGFKQGKFAVHCDTEEKAKAFLRECDEHGIIWCSGDLATMISCWVSDKRTYYVMFEGKLAHSLYGYLKHKGLEIVKYPFSIREVKRPAKIGEWIKIVETEEPCNGYSIGDILQVKKLKNSYGTIKEPYWIVSCEYVVLENYQPEATKTLSDYTGKELFDELSKRWEDKR